MKDTFLFSKEMSTCPEDVDNEKCDLNKVYDTDDDYKKNIGNTYRFKC